MTKKVSLWHRAHAWANRHEYLFALWTLLILLRLPNLVEPYWYGDEAIYLTIGTAIRHGLKLYAQIIDHKTPLIYYLAAVPNQLSFRVLLIVWMIVATGFFQHLAKKFMPPIWAFAASAVFVLLTSLPAFEGHIPNGELFVMGFILASLWLLDKSPWISWLTKDTAPNWKLEPADWRWIGLSGAVASLGVLTKVPAILDVGAIGALMLFAVARHFTQRKWQPALKTLLVSWCIFGVGVVAPIIASIGYYWLRGSLDAYVQFGLLYNFHYTGNWTLPFTQDWLLALFTLPGKAVIVALSLVLTLGLAFYKKKEAATSWALFWIWATTFAALLSNRPYPHYFQQVVPAFSLVAIAFFIPARTALSRVLTLGSTLILVGVLVLLQFRPYAITEYYSRYIKLATGQISLDEYRSGFNWLVSQNAQIVPIIQRESSEDARIFIWGTNPMLYAQSKRSPATRFTVAFHIHDLKVYEETMNEIRENKPAFIIVMKEETELAGLSVYLQDHYIWTFETQDMVVYRRSSLTSLQLVQ
jgi:hypothetical protein